MPLVHYTLLPSMYDSGHPRKLCMSVCIEMLILANKHLHVLKGIDLLVLNLPSSLNKF